MMTVSQVTKLTGISARTLQYYDEIGLLKPSDLTSSGYRLYDDEALQQLQQILFFKELGFTLQEINKFISHPNFDRIEAYKKQKELLLLKRNRTDRLIELLERLERGEQCMSFKEFDLSNYINALEAFKSNSADDIVKYWGSIDNFNLFIAKIKEDESEIAKHAIKQFGSIENYTEAMTYNLEHFSEIMEQQMSDEVKEVAKQNEFLFTKLTGDISKDISSPEIQQIVQDIDILLQTHTSADVYGHDYWNSVIHSYSSDYVKTITDTKYGSGASDYIVRALQYYSDHKVWEC